jgi:hypothetical protein
VVLDGDNRLEPVCFLIGILASVYYIIVIGILV